MEQAYRFGIDESYDPGIDWYIDEFLSNYRIDAVVVEYVFLSRALIRVPAGALRVIDTHDVFADRHRRYLDNETTPTWYSCSSKTEAKGLSRADVVTLIQDTEVGYFHRVTDSRVVTKWASNLATRHVAFTEYARANSIGRVRQRDKFKIA